MTQTSAAALRFRPLARGCVLLFSSVMIAASGVKGAETLVEPVDASNAPRGVNIALRANGGRLDLANPAAEEKFNQNLNDGYSSEWRARGKQVPQDLVFSFAGNGTAMVDRVVLDLRTRDIAANSGRAPRQIEIAVSSKSPTDGFKTVATGELQKKAARQLITFEPSPARHLRVRFKSTYGDAVQIAEVEAYEAEGHPSVREGWQLNIAAAGNGGAVVRFNEPSKDAAWLLDGQSRGWHTDRPARSAELVFAFRGDREALVGRVSIEPRSNHPADTMARSGKVFISNQTPLEGFEEVGAFEIEKDTREVSVPVDRPAKFVKIAITANRGGKFTSLGEVRIIEGQSPDRRSIMLAPEMPAAVTNTASLEGEPEAEPNHPADLAGLLILESPLRGEIKPLGDEDFYTLEVGQPKFPDLSIELRGRPYIRTSLTLHQGDRKLAEFDPTNAAGESTIIKFPVSAGNYGIRVFEPPTSLLLVYDASSSMTASMTNLRVAVDSYVENLRPSVLVNLIRFDSKYEVVLPEFTSDQAKLKEAVAKKFAVGKGTAFYDAVNQGCVLLKGVSGNRAMIVMTDGADSSSKTNYPGFWQLVGEHKVRLYTVGFGNEMDLLDDDIGSTPRRMMNHIALATHGRGFMTESAEELKNLYEAIGNEIRRASEYSLLAFWGDEPPSVQAQARAAEAARKKAAMAKARRLLIFILIALAVVAVLTTVFFIVRKARARRTATLPNKLKL
jgi:hypothetical protein